ncbi:MAG: hypothetical protein JXR70_06210 [Spirochaetales bacterium]|nr:hypothetical protein [Spirochaetales bacterium]
MNAKSIILCAIIISVFFACESSPDIESSAFSTAPLYGMIYDNDNLPVVNAEIRIDNGAIVVRSDINGRFIVNGLARGSHQFEVIKTEYKLFLPGKNPFQYDFVNREQFLYLKMISLEQIIAEVEKEISESEWEAAHSGLDMIKEIDADNKIAIYLRAVINYKTRNYPQAIELLNQLLDLGASDSGIYLTLADIYEYKMGDPLKAHAVLLEYSDLYNSDDSINARKFNLVKFIPQEKKDLTYSELRLQLEAEKKAAEAENAGENENSTE